MELSPTLNPAERGESVTAYATGMGAVEQSAAKAATTAQQPASPLLLYPGEGGGLKLFFCSPEVTCRPTEAVSSTALFAGLDTANGFGAREKLPGYAHEKLTT